MVKASRIERYLRLKARRHDLELKIRALRASTTDIWVDVKCTGDRFLGAWPYDVPIVAEALRWHIDSIGVESIVKGYGAYLESEIAKIDEEMRSLGIENDVA